MLGVALWLIVGPVEAIDRVRFDDVIELKSICDRSFLKDRDGFIWIGCQTGLIRFDGQKTKVYTSKNSGLSSSYKKIFCFVHTIPNARESCNTDRFS